MFFFFKQKTAYEMRISDWSSDVCSSDLDRGGVREQRDALAFERSQKRRVGEQAVDTEVNSHDASGAPSVSAKQSGGWKSGLPGGCGQDRESGVWGEGVAVRVDRGGRRIIKKKKPENE